MKDPLQVFDALKINPNCKIKDLWPHQKEALQVYRDILAKEKRAAIELPTGAGKSLIALLILEGWRQAGKKVAFLTSTKTLAADIVNKANEVGLKNVFEITGKTGLSESELIRRGRYLIAYKRGDAITVMNYWAYLYGDFVTPDVLIIDDAHSFENAAYSHFSLEISREDHKELYNRIVHKLKTAHPIYQRLESIERYLTPSNIYEAIYLPHTLEVLKDIKTYFFSLKEDQTARWQFKRNLDRLHTYFMLINRESILLIPIVFPIESEEKLRLVDKIIYMSATLGTHEVFHKSVGSYLPIRILSESDLTNKIGTMGKRLIFPLSLTPETGYIDERVYEAVDAILSQFGKAVVFCASKDDREELSVYLLGKDKKVYPYTYESDVESFSKQGAGTALITAGRYIGLDLPSRICQVGIITRVPFNFDPLDSFIEVQLGDMDFIYQQVAHRLVQAFGRCNRSLTDIAIYFCLDGRLESEITGTERITKHFPSELMAQSQLGYERCQKSLDKGIGNGLLFLSGKMPEYESEVRNILELVPLRGRVEKDAPVVVLDEIRGWTELIVNQNYYAASQIFKRGAEHYSKEMGLQVGRRAAWFWYWSAMCDYLQFKLQNAGEPLKRACIEKLEKAIEHGSSGWFNNMRVIINELKGEATDDAVIADSVDWTFREKVLRNWIDFNMNNTTKKKSPLSVYDELLEKLQKGSHEEILKAVEELFYLYGFEVRNYSHKKGENDLHFYANDVQNKYMVLVEIKSKKESDVLGKRDVDQAKSNITQYQQKYSAIGMKVYCLIITNKSTIDPLAIDSAKKQCKIMKSDSAIHLAKSYLPLMEESWKLPDDAYERTLFLNEIPTLNTLRSLFEEIDQPEITIDDIEKIFKKS